MLIAILTPSYSQSLIKLIILRLHGVPSHTMLITVLIIIIRIYIALLQWFPQLYINNIQWIINNHDPYWHPEAQEPGYRKSGNSSMKSGLVSWLCLVGGGRLRQKTLTDQKWMTAEQVLRMCGWRESCLWRWCLVANDHRQQRQYHFLLPRPLPARCYRRKGSSGVARWCQITTFCLINSLAKTTFSDKENIYAIIENIIINGCRSDGLTSECTADTIVTGIRL